MNKEAAARKVGGPSEATHVKVQSPPKERSEGCGGGGGEATAVNVALRIQACIYILDGHDQTPAPGAPIYKLTVHYNTTDLG